MTYSVYQHWDPLKVCVVGRSYPPEFYDWIKVPHVRNLFERIAIETEEDYQKIIAVLEKFDVTVLRPDIPDVTRIQGVYQPPPMTPRDWTVMIGDIFYENITFDHGLSYNNVRDKSWPSIVSQQDYDQLPAQIRQECEQFHGFWQYRESRRAYDKIFKHISDQGNTIRSHACPISVDGKIQYYVNGAAVARIGKDLFFGTGSYSQDIVSTKCILDRQFPLFRNHVVNTGGHSDGTYCPVAPGLIISLKDVPTYAETFPDWEVVYLPGQSWEAVRPFLDLKAKNRGRWWIPGFEHDQDVIDVVEIWLSHWTGYVEETVFDVNMLIIDPKNVMVFNYNKQVFDALDRYGITPHVVPFRHRFFWDGGIHCVTSDLHRDGVKQDYFPDRS
jgi:hypothetical protein